MRTSSQLMVVMSLTVLIFAATKRSTWSQPAFSVAGEVAHAVVGGGLNGILSTSDPDVFRKAIEQLQGNQGASSCADRLVLHDLAQNVPGGPQKRLSTEPLMYGPLQSG